MEKDIPHSNIQMYEQTCNICVCCDTNIRGAIIQFMGKLESSFLLW